MKRKRENEKKKTVKKKNTLFNRKEDMSDGH